MHTHIWHFERLPIHSSTHLRRNFSAGDFLIDFDWIHIIYIIFSPVDKSHTNAKQYKYALKRLLFMLAHISNWFVLRNEHCDEEEKEQTRSREWWADFALTLKLMQTSKLNNFFVCSVHKFYFSNFHMPIQLHIEIVCFHSTSFFLFRLNACFWEIYLVICIFLFFCFCNILQLFRPSSLLWYTMCTTHGSASSFEWTLALIVS